MLEVLMGPKTPFVVDVDRLQQLRDASRLGWSEGARGRELGSCPHVGDSQGIRPKWDRHCSLTRHLAIAAETVLLEPGIGLRASGSLGARPGASYRRGLNCQYRSVIQAMKPWPIARCLGTNTSAAHAAVSWHFVSRRGSRNRTHRNCEGCSAEIAPLADGRNARKLVEAGS